MKDKQTKDPQGKQRKSTSGYLDERAKFAKGNPGRPKGTPNKVTADLRQIFLEVFDRLGGADWLYKFALDHEETYFNGLMRLLPKQQEIKVDDSAGEGGIAVQYVLAAPLPGVQAAYGAAVEKYQKMLESGGN